MRRRSLLSNPAADPSAAGGAPSAHSSEAQPMASHLMRHIDLPPYDMPPYIAEDFVISPHEFLMADHPPTRVLEYTAKSGKTVKIKAEPDGLQMWTGSSWVAAHVVPTRAK